MAGADSDTAVLERPQAQRSLSDVPGPITVAVTNYNGAAYLEDCLRSVRALRGRVLDVIVIDNASTDASVEVIQRHPVRLVQMHRNDGPCPARNRGLIEATTKWVLQIDSDVVLPPDLLELLWPEREDTAVAIVQPRAVLAHDPDVVHYDGGRMHYVGVMCLDHLLERVEEVPGPSEDVDAVISMALLLDRLAVLDAGGYDEAFFILFEDHDLSYRLRVRGRRLVRVPRARVLHREGTAGISYRPGAASYPETRAFLHARNRTYLVLKNYTWRALVLSLPGRWVYGTVWALFALKRGVFRAYLRGRWELLGLIPRALAQRRRLRGQRRVGDRELLVADDLTFSPVIERTRLEAGLESLLGGTLRTWWRLVRWLVP